MVLRVQGQHRGRRDTARQRTVQQSPMRVHAGTRRIVGDEECRQHERRQHRVQCGVGKRHAGDDVPRQQRDSRAGSIASGACQRMQPLASKASPASAYQIASGAHGAIPAFDEEAAGWNANASALAIIAGWKGLAASLPRKYIPMGMRNSAAPTWVAGVVGASNAATSNTRRGKIQFRSRTVSNAGRTRLKLSRIAIAGKELRGAAQALATTAGISARLIQRARTAPGIARDASAGKVGPVVMRGSGFRLLASATRLRARDRRGDGVGTDRAGLAYGLAFAASLVVARQPQLP